MPRVVLDSSILVSAFIAPQSELMRLLRLPLRRRYELVLSKEILSETAQSLLTKESIRHYATYQAVDKMVGLLVRPNMLWPVSAERYTMWCAGLWATNLSTACYADEDVHAYLAWLLSV